MWADVATYLAPCAELHRAGFEVAIGFCHQASLMLAVFLSSFIIRVRIRTVLQSVKMCTLIHASKTSLPSLFAETSLNLSVDGTAPIQLALALTLTHKSDGWRALAAFLPPFRLNAPMRAGADAWASDVSI